MKDPTPSAAAPAAVRARRRAGIRWNLRHAARGARAARGAYDLVFLGDSITQGWETAGRTAWDRHYAPRRALNLRFNGDRTEHVLWRLDHGGFPARPPRLVVLQIGTNNTGHRNDPPGHTAGGIRRILARIGELAAAARILLLAVFPRDATPEGAGRMANDRLNRMLRGLADGDRVTFLDINDRLLRPDGTLSPEIMPDFLHPSPRGYAIWAEAMEPEVARILGNPPAHSAGIRAPPRGA